MKVGVLTSALDRKAPPSTAESWDNVGLLVGDPAWETRGAVISVDLTEESLELAAKNGYSLVINHHPCIFPKSRGLSRVTAGSGLPSLVFRALAEKIAVYCTHTNFDQCALEVPEAICRDLGAVAQGRLHDVSVDKLLKLVAFVPETHIDAVREALFSAGAGQVGHYDSCSFGAGGEGTFKGNEMTRPFQGQAGVLERAREIRLETVLPSGLKHQVVSALLDAHPYEEVAYDLYPLQQNPPSKGVVSGLGYGFWADFQKPLEFEEFQARLLSAFGCDAFLHTVPSA